MYPELVFNKIGATQTMDGPVSQIFYMGNSRAIGSDEQIMYSKFNITPRNLVAGKIGSISAVGATFDPANGASALTYDAAVDDFDLSNVLASAAGSPSTTMGGQLAAFPLSTTILATRFRLVKDSVGPRSPRSIFTFRSKPFKLVSVR